MQPATSTSFTRGLAEACRRLGVEFVGDAKVTRLAKTGSAVDVTWQEAGDTVHPQTQPVRQHRDLCGRGEPPLRCHVRRSAEHLSGKRLFYHRHARRGQKPRRCAWVSLLDDAAKIVTSRLGADRFRVAGTAEFNGENRDIRADRIQPLIDWVRMMFPGVNTSRIVPWAGLRPMMPSMMPRVGAGKHRGVFYNTGHGHLGWTLSCATAQVVAESVGSQLGAPNLSATF